jgi:hypothetical protein
MELRWNGKRMIREKLPDNSDTLITCWITHPVDGFYDASTVNLQTNEKKRIPLNYVSNRTHRLEIKYSLLVRQYPLSDGAYHYFNSKKSEIQEAGGLYDIQPVQNQSNIVNSDDPDEKILGYFWASSFTEKRIFVEPPFNFVLLRYCQPSTIDWQSINRSRSSISFYITMIEGMEYTAEDMCFDCTQTGGKLKRPEFWE